MKLDGSSDRKLLSGDTQMKVSQITFALVIILILTSNNHHSYTRYNIYTDTTVCEFVIDRKFASSDKSRWPEHEQG